MVQRYYLSDNPEEIFKKINDSFIPNEQDVIIIDKTRYKIYQKIICLGNYDINYIKFYINEYR